jgi:hypothetical protein
MADDTPEVTAEVLRSIRDEITGLRADTNVRFVETNASIARVESHVGLSE